MFEYNIYKDADNDKFIECCTKIENSDSSLLKRDLLIDVDGSLIQIYLDKNNKSIDVHNDYLVGAVYIVSEIDLEKVFK